MRTLSKYTEGIHQMPRTGSARSANGALSIVDTQVNTRMLCIITHLVQY